MNPSRIDSSVALSAVGRAAPLLLLVLAVACGDSGTGGAGGDGANGTGGTGAGATGGGNTGGTGTTGGGGQGTGGGPMCTAPGTNVMPGECDLVLQDCPVPTDTCTLVNGDMSGMTYVPTTGCVTYNGLKGVGESCMQETACQAHLTCVGGTCTPFCCDGADSVCQGGSCSVNVSLLDQNGMPAMCGNEPCMFQACSYAATCNLFDPNACPPNENCYFDSPGLAICYPPVGGVGNETPDGEACMSLNECGESTVCIGDMNGAVCHYMCQAGSMAPPGQGGCPAGQLCDTNSFDTGFANVGFCHN